MDVAAPGGGTFHVDVRGEGAPLLLLHGFTGSNRSWPDDCLDGLARVGRVVAPDLPGHGRTGVAGDAPPGLTQVLDGLEALLDGSSAEKATWIGYSMGGRIALAAAVLRPHRVGRLVLESTSPGLSTERERRARRERDEALADSIQERGVGPFVDAWMAQPLFRTERGLPEHIRQTERQRRLKNRSDGLAAALRGLGTGALPSFWDRLDGVAMPALVLTGGLDEKFAGIGRRMAHVMPGARLEVVPGAGHRVHLERPAEWSCAVEAFLDETSPVP